MRLVDGGNALEGRVRSSAHFWLVECLAVLYLLVQGVQFVDSFNSFLIPYTILSVYLVQYHVTKIIVFLHGL